MPASLHRPVHTSAVFTGYITAFRESSIQGVKQHKHGRETDLRPDITVRDEGRHHYSS